MPNGSGEKASQLPGRYTPEQLMLFELLKQTFHRSWYDWYQQNIVGLCTQPLASGLIAIIVFLTIAVVYLMTAWVGTVVSQLAMWVCVLLAMIPVQQARKEADAGIIRQQGDRILLGRMADAFVSNATGPGTLIAVLLGVQWALLACAGWRMGVPIDKMTAGQALGYTCDNFLQACFADVFELYDWRTMPKIEHTVASATTFLFFRTSASALSLYWLYLQWQRFLARRLMQQFPSDCSYQEMVDWLRELSRTEKSWMLRFFDEFLFLRICGEFLAGNYDAVRRLSEQFPRLQVDNHLRNVFVDQTGIVQLQGYRVESND